MNEGAKIGASRGRLSHECAGADQSQRATRPTLRRSREGRALERGCDRLLSLRCRGLAGSRQAPRREVCVRGGKVKRTSAGLTVALTSTLQNVFNGCELNTGQYQ